MKSSLEEHHKFFRGLADKSHGFYQVKAKSNLVLHCESYLAAMSISKPVPNTMPNKDGGCNVPEKNSYPSAKHEEAQGK